MFLLFRSGIFRFQPLVFGGVNQQTTKKKSDKKHSEYIFTIIARALLEVIFNRKGDLFVGFPKSPFGVSRMLEVS